LVFLFEVNQEITLGRLKDSAIRIGREPAEKRLELTLFMSTVLAACFAWAATPALVPMLLRNKEQGAKADRQMRMVANAVESRDFGDQEKSQKAELQEV
jgi:hypothetical protein